MDIEENRQTANAIVARGKADFLHQKLESKMAMAAMSGATTMMAGNCAVMIFDLQKRAHVGMFPDGLDELFGSNVVALLYDTKEALAHDIA